MSKFDPRFWEVPFDPDVLENVPVERFQDQSPADERRLDLQASAMVQLRIVVGTRLTERQKQVVQMYFFERMTQEEIAADLGIAQQVVSKHLFGVIRKGKRVGGAIAKLRVAAAELGIDPRRWV